MAAHPELPDTASSDQPAIPLDLINISKIINACPDQNRRFGLPLRSWMHSAVPGVLDCRIRVLRKTHPLVQHIGDPRLFSHRLWAWICFSGPATEPGKGKYEALYDAKLKLSSCDDHEGSPSFGELDISPDICPDSQALRVDAPESPLQHFGLGSTRALAATRGRHQRRGRTKWTVKSNRSKVLPSNHDHVHIEIPCVVTGCQNKLCTRCAQEHYDELSHGQRSALDTGTLMPLCTKCQDTSDDVQALHCSCVALSHYQRLCLPHLRAKLSRIADLKAEYTAKHRWANSRYLGELRRVLRCCCGEVICEPKDDVRRCCVCGHNVRTPNLRDGQECTVKYSAGVEPFTI